MELRCTCYLEADKFFQVHVKTLTEKTVPFEVGPKTTIGGLKRLIEAPEGLPKERQRLILFGRQPDDSCMMQDYDFKDGCKFQLI
jgi:hypothetical protein